MVDSPENAKPVEEDEEGEEGSDVEGIDDIEDSPDTPKPDNQKYADKEYVDNMFHKLVLELNDVKSQLMIVKMRADESLLERLFRKFR